MFTSLLRTLLLFVLLTAGMLAASTNAFADDATAHYMANEGLMVVHDDTKIVFDPLFRNDYGQYLLLPPEMEAALFAGEPPFDGIDAVFVSHYHGDHFSPEDMLRLLKEQQGIQLYAPTQAVVAMRTVASAEDQRVFERVNAVSLEYKDAPVTLEMDELIVEAIRIPHSGWPTGRVDVENIVWRVTMNDATTILHLGDADPNDVHFANDAAYWDRNQPHVAFPPYWFFSSASGRRILQQRIRAARNVGIHVPVQIPADPLRRPNELRSADLFTTPGETRSVSH